MVRRLALAGIESVNNVVDALNYAMVEVGQPMHAYDVGRLASPILEVRRSSKGERLHLLSQSSEELPAELPPDTLVVASAGRVVAVAGVMGGTETGVSESTTSVLIEAGCFDFISVRKAQAGLKIFSDSSARFSRGVEFNLCTLGMRRALELLSQSCLTLRVISAGDAIVARPVRKPIEVSLGEINDSLGIDFSVAEVQQLLSRLEISVDVRDGQTLEVRLPEYRSDLHLPCDIIEELARIAGYDRLSETMPLEPVALHPPDRSLVVREACRDALVNWGLQETITYTLSSVQLESRVHAGATAPPLPSDYVQVKNPINADRTVVRQSLLPAMLQTMHRNLRWTDGCHLFEIGVVAFPTEEALPREEYRIAIGLTGALEPASLHAAERREADFYDLADSIHALFEHLHLNVSLEPAEPHAPYQPGICARVMVGSDCVGHAGAIHPSVAAAFDLGDRRVMCAELHLHKICAVVPNRCSAVLPSKFPTIELDISVLVGSSVSAAELTRTVHSLGGHDLRDVVVFDLYTGPRVPVDTKAVGLRIVVGSDSRTLTTGEAFAVRTRIADGLVERLGASIR